MRFINTSRSGSNVIPEPGCGTHANEVYPHNEELNAAIGSVATCVSEVLAGVVQLMLNAHISSASEVAPQESSRIRITYAGVPAGGSVVPFKLTGVAAWNPMVPKEFKVKR